MSDTAEERDAVAAAIAGEGARPVRFEELGRDADAQEAYISGVESSTVYFGILKDTYGRIDRTGFSATETEYNRARSTGKRIAVFVAAAAPAREGHLRQFIDRVRVFITTEDFTDPQDLANRARRRLNELASEALSPWIKLNELVFRADEIVDRGGDLTVVAQASDDIARRLEALRDQAFGRSRIRFTYGDRVVDASVARVERTVRFSGAADLRIELTGATRVQGGGFGSRVGTTGSTPDDLVEIGLRELFLGESPRHDLTLMGLTRTGIDQEDVVQTFSLPNEIAGGVLRLVLTDGLVGTGNAERITDLRLGPLVGGGRQIYLEWEPPRIYGSESAPRRVTGEWSPVI